MSSRIKLTPEEMVSKYITVFNCPKSLFMFIDNPEMPKGHFLLSNISMRPVNTLANPYKEGGKPYTARPDQQSKPSRPNQNYKEKEADSMLPPTSRSQRGADEPGRDLVKWAKSGAAEPPRRQVGVRDEAAHQPPKVAQSTEPKQEPSPPSFIQIPSNLTPEEQLQFLLKMQNQTKPSSISLPAEAEPVKEAEVKIDNGYKNRNQKNTKIEIKPDQAPSEEKKPKQLKKEPEMVYKPKSKPAQDPVVDLPPP